ncbi:MAG: PAS domain-containing protein [Desulfobacter sp.]|nr:MAG: PAS domain-containing protein [Desulfobacter sp.]
MNSHKRIDDYVSNAILSSIPEPFFVFDENGYYVDILGGVDRDKYHDGQHLIGKRIHDVIDVKAADDYLHQIKKAIRLEKVIYYDYRLSATEVKGSENLPGPKGPQWFEAHISPIEKIHGKPRMVVWIAFNVTESRKALTEKEALILELKKANNEIKDLSGLLPICSMCKKIRDDKGYWSTLETYIEKHSDASFSHGMCTDCAEKLYGKEGWYLEMKKKKGVK